MHICSSISMTKKKNNNKYDETKRERGKKGNWKCNKNG